MSTSVAIICTTSVEGAWLKGPGKNIDTGLKNNYVLSLSPSFSLFTLTPSLLLFLALSDRQTAAHRLGGISSVDTSYSQEPFTMWLAHVHVHVHVQTQT